VLLSGCAASANIGAIQHPLAHDLGGAVDTHLGLGRVIDPNIDLDVNLRGDVGDRNSRLAIGGSVFAGKVIANGYRVLARAGIWRAVVSSVGERAVVPTFELAAYIPLRETPDPGSKYGWNAAGVVVGVREDLDLVAYTTLFVGYQLMFVPGY
jgi:hypothetical protein